MFVRLNRKYLRIIVHVTMQHALFAEHIPAVWCNIRDGTKAKRPNVQGAAAEDSPMVNGGGGGGGVGDHVNVSYCRSHTNGSGVIAT